MQAPRATEVLSPPVLIVQGMKLRNSLRLGVRYGLVYIFFFVYFIEKVFIGVFKKFISFL